MAGRLFFRYGAMGSSKTAQALITRFNYIENGIPVWLIKPSVDIRDGANLLRSRVGIEAVAQPIGPAENITEIWSGKENVIIADEVQFFSAQQVEQLRTLADNGCQVWCYGLKTNFQSFLFEGSKRLIELADSIEEIKTVCSCGAKAIINARVDSRGRVVTKGEELVLGGSSMYRSMCHKCYVRAGGVSIK